MTKRTAVVAAPRIVPIVESLSWQADALCRDNDAEIFFSPSGEGRSARRMREESAKVVCAQCPVIAQCKQFALAANEPFGVWGGMTARERSLRRASERKAG